jgi:hypothetical protein
MTVQQHGCADDLAVDPASETDYLARCVQPVRLQQSHLRVEQVLHVSGVHAQHAVVHAVGNVAAVQRHEALSATGTGETTPVVARVRQLRFQMGRRVYGLHEP